MVLSDTKIIIIEINISVNDIENIFCAAEEQVSELKVIRTESKKKHVR